MISFIIPTKNEEKIIEKTLECISLYRGEKEIIVSDGQSTDNTISISKKYAKVVEHKGKTRQKISEGRNSGANIALGEYLVFMDADVNIPDINSFFEKAKEIFNSNKNLLGITVSVRVFKEQETFGDKMVFSFFNFYNMALNNYLKIGAAVGEFQMVRKDIFQKVGGYREDLVAGEDYEFFNKISKMGKTYFVKNLKVYHTGRRAHKIGWPRLLTQWMLNWVYVNLKGKSFSEEWEVIR
jgi:glycosyltransferase involved in cell wall biosynthesis